MRQNEMTKKLERSQKEAGERSGRSLREVREKPERNQIEEKPEKQQKVEEKPKMRRARNNEDVKRCNGVYLVCSKRYFSLKSSGKGNFDSFHF